MNDAEANPNLTSADLARAEAALTAFFQAEKPKVWPAAPTTEPLRPAPRGSRLQPSHLALALSVAFLAFGLSFAGSFSAPEEPKPLPDGAGPASAHRPAGAVKRPAASRLAPRFH